MAYFDWTERDGLDGSDRYQGDGIVGSDAWSDLWWRLRDLSREFGNRFQLFGGEVAMEEPWDDAFQEFLERVASTPDPKVRPCCVFISHRQADWAKAERIAYLATQAGLEYWLDIHDPSLIAANRAGLASPAKEILIAAVIEMGLLNSTHVIALHTANSAGSKWIPYELGRVKQRRIFSSRACGWFDPSGGIAPAAGEYSFLAARTASESEVVQWLRAQVGRGGCQPSRGSWPKPTTPKPL